MVSFSPNQGPAALNSNADSVARVDSPFETRSADAIQGPRPYDKPRTTSPVSSPATAGLVTVTAATAAAAAGGPSPDPATADASGSSGHSFQPVGPPLTTSNTHQARWQIQFDKSQQIFPAQACLLLANLNNNYTDAQLAAIITDAIQGLKIKHRIRVYRNHGRGAVRPNAHVQFQTVKDANTAGHYLQGRLIGSRPIRVERTNAHILNVWHRDGRNLTIADEERVIKLLLDKRQWLAVQGAWLYAGFPVVQGYVPGRMEMHFWTVGGRIEASRRLQDADVAGRVQDAGYII